MRAACAYGVLYFLLMLALFSVLPWLRRNT